MPEAREATQRRLQQLCDALDGVRRLLILTHDNPDPDAVASGWALLRVVRRLRRIQVDLAYGGIIGRSENRALSQVLRVPLRPIDSVDPDTYQALALVDCQPRTGNNSLPPGRIPTLVIDHHPLRPETRQVPFFDIRENYGATATILSEYLLASGAKVDRRLATSLFYAIKAETQNLGREASKADVRAFLRFFPWVDNQALSQIENPPIPRVYFSMIDQAIDGTRLYGPVAITRLGRVSNPDIVAEFADLMVRLESVRWALSLGRFGPDLVVSIRTNQVRANAGRMIRWIVGPRGRAGGHGMMAGGKLEGGARDEEEAERLEDWLQARALRVLKADVMGVQLVDRSVLPIVSAFPVSGEAAGGARESEREE